MEESSSALCRDYHPADLSKSCVLEMCWLNPLLPTDSTSHFDLAGYNPAGAAARPEAAKQQSQLEVASPVCSPRCSARAPKIKSSSQKARLSNCWNRGPPPGGLVTCHHGELGWPCDHVTQPGEVRELSRGSWKDRDLGTSSLGTSRVKDTPNKMQHRVLSRLPGSIPRDYTLPFRGTEAQSWCLALPTDGASRGPARLCQLLAL